MAVIMLDKRYFKASHSVKLKSFLFPSLYVNCDFFMFHNGLYYPEYRLLSQIIEIQILLRYIFKRILSVDLSVSS
ncbi:hypothetical protein ABE55_13865 [Bacillus thuringiensis]|nr:hypothetical protein [Bacillus thuringiensis]